MIGSFDPSVIETDLVVTTVFHAAEVRAARWRPGKSIAAAPHVTSLVRITSVPKNRVVSICCVTAQQAVRIRDPLKQSRIENLRVTDADLDDADLDDADPDDADPDDADPDDVDLVVTPSGPPDLTSSLRQRVRDAGARRRARGRIRRDGRGGAR